MISSYDLGAKLVAAIKSVLAGTQFSNVEINYMSDGHDEDGLFIRYYPKNETDLETFTNTSQGMEYQVDIYHPANASNKFPHPKDHSDLFDLIGTVATNDDILIQKVHSQPQFQDREKNRWWAFRVVRVTER